MSEEDFLSRWSRRKREAERSALAPPAPQSSSESKSPSKPQPASVSAPETETSGLDSGAPPASPAGDEDFDLSELPPLESITSATDVTAFLRKGVPVELSRAALRRAWSADPVIRDFVGLSENAWDFNDPNAIPGFGPFDCSQERMREMVGKIVGEMREAVTEVMNSEHPHAPEIGSQPMALASGPGPSVPSAVEPDAAAAGQVQAHLEPVEPAANGAVQ
ncbi:MAG: DUF3306 domain-containing protein, partial [Rhizobiales bacterium]|nr:DUF3306 domain-containing protein [Hyphomicrobiales bacterium]